MRDSTWHYYLALGITAALAALAGLIVKLVVDSLDSRKQYELKAEIRRLKKALEQPCPEDKMLLLEVRESRDKLQAVRALADFWDQHPGSPDGLPSNCMTNDCAAFWLLEVLES